MIIEPDYWPNRSSACLTGQLRLRRDMLRMQVMQVMQSAARIGDSSHSAAVNTRQQSIALF
ncbi:hypothetical protein WIW49_00360 [Xanthomonas euroxanthea]|jgi:hypothetical protein